MHHPTDRIAHTTAFVTPVVEHWLEREIAQWVHHEGSIQEPIIPWVNAYYRATPCYIKYSLLSETDKFTVPTQFSFHEGLIRWPIAPWANALTIAQGDATIVTRVKTAVLNDLQKHYTDESARFLMLQSSGIWSKIQGLAICWCRWETWYSDLTHNFGRISWQELEYGSFII